jgi:hypothetical protein
MLDGTEYKSALDADAMLGPEAPVRVSPEAVKKFSSAVK